MVFTLKLHPFQQNPIEEELTDLHINALAPRLHETDIRKIGLRCGISADDIMNHCENVSTTQAAHSILTQILRSHPDRKQALSKTWPSAY